MLSKRLFPFAVGVMNLLPHRLALGLGAFLGRLLWLFGKRKVDRAEARCVSALGVGITTARKIVRSSYANMGKCAVEFARLNRLLPILDSLVEIDGKEHLDEALKRGKGALVMAAHMGNWELGGARMVSEGYAITPFYTPQRRNAEVNDWIVKLRTKTAGMRVIPSGGFALREAFRSLREGSVLTFLQDLDAREDGVCVPFLGLPASCATGLIKMHRKFGSPVVPILVLRAPDGVRHTVFVQNILSDFPDDEGNPFGANMENSLKMCNNVLEKWIVDHPEQWMWLLDKWGYGLRCRVS